MHRISVFLITYIAVHILTFVLVRYVYLRNHFKTANKDKFKERFGPFMRTDLNKLHLLWSFPYYITFWPRFTMSWIITLACTFTCLLVSKLLSNVPKM